MHGFLLELVCLNADFTPSLVCMATAAAAHQRSHHIFIILIMYNIKRERESCKHSLTTVSTATSIGRTPQYFYYYYSSKYYYTVLNNVSYCTNISYNTRRMQQ